MTGRLPKGEKKLRDAVAAKLKRSQNAAGLSDKKRAEQNRRVANKIQKKGDS